MTFDIVTVARIKHGSEKKCKMWLRLVNEFLFPVIYMVRLFAHSGVSHISHGKLRVCSRV